MMQFNGRGTRGVALLVGGAVAASALIPATPAQAVEKSKAYKAGAVVLGAASAYLILKGKTVPGAVAGAGAYYAYKKGQKEAGREDQYGYGQYPAYPDDRYSQYPNDPGYDYGNGGYAQYPNDPAYDYNNGGYVQYPDNGYRGAAPSTSSRMSPRFAPSGRSSSRIVVK